VINIATVHFQTAQWIDPQRRYLDANITAPFRVFASLEGIDRDDVRSGFFAVSDAVGTHPEKLNALAELISSQSDPSDVLVFVDGDAFPVRPLVPWIEEKLRSFPLVAVRRAENAGDPQPHPCFCATTVGFWNELGGDWRYGSWTNASGQTASDVGGTLLHQLEGAGIEWYPMLRSNTVNTHPLWFALYEQRIYHHGAGFRAKMKSRADQELLPEWTLPPPPRGEVVGLGSQARTVLRDPARLLRLRPRHVADARQAAANTIGQLRRQREWERRVRLMDRARPESQRVFEDLCRDPQFFRRFEA
jgi:hypothetical protein